MNRSGWLVGGATLLVAIAVHAQPSAPEIQVQTDESIVSVGDVVHIEVTATSADATPSDPRLGPAPGFLASGPSSSSSQTHINMNGVRTDRYTLTAAFALTAKQVGKFSVGPPSVVVGATRYSGRAVAIQVVPPGKAPSRRPPGRAPQPSFGISPFDPWRGLFPGLMSPDAPVPAQTVTLDPKLSLDAPSGQFIFLHAFTDKVTGVVGEQFVFTVALYEDVDSHGFEAQEGHEAQADAFVKHSLLKDDEDTPLLGYAAVAGRTYKVLALRKWALFPLRAGDLVIGPMSVSLRSGRTGDTKRISETLHVRVSEPPLAGRPPGYVLGDVGHFSLGADVTPREMEQGGAVGVHVELTGTGNMPGAVALPGRGDLDVLPAEVHDKLGPIGRQAFGGTRSFDFVVRVKRAGTVDLGTVTLPFWNPDEKRYDVARAPLGSLRVSPSSGATPDPSESQPELLAGLPGPRDGLEGAPPSALHPDDSPLFWLLAVAGGPVAFGAAVLGKSAGARATHALRRRRSSPLAELRQRLAAARSACEGSDARAADAAVMRALEVATIAHAGVNVRGAFGAEVIKRLEAAGVPLGQASLVADILRECELARFSPATADLASARDRWQRAQGAIAGLARTG